MVLGRSRRAARNSVLAALALMAPVAAMAQFTDGYNFLKAVRDRDGKEVNDLLAKPVSGAVLINTRDTGNGDTALHIVTARRDTQWLGFLISKGGDPNLRNNAGQTPLLIAARMQYDEGVKILLRGRARPDLADNMGVTPLIEAVHNHDLETARVLLVAGANPNKSDNSGQSAKSYASRDPRDAALARLIAQTPARRSNPMGPN